MAGTIGTSSAMGRVLNLSSRACFVDVRDLALAHVLAVTKPEAGGERILVSHSPFKWQDFGERGLTEVLS